LIDLKELPPIQHFEDIFFES